MCLGGRDKERPWFWPQSQLGTAPGGTFSSDSCRVLGREDRRAGCAWLAQPLGAHLVADWGEGVGSSRSLDWGRGRIISGERGGGEVRCREHRIRIHQEAKPRRPRRASLSPRGHQLSLAMQKLPQAGWGPGSWGELNRLVCWRKDVSKEKTHLASGEGIQ